MKKIYISEEQKKAIKKAIAAQDQVGGKVNAGIMGAVTGMVCEAHGDDIQTWYRGYNADLPNLGVPDGGGLWLTDEYDYAKQYADHFDNGKVAAVTIDFTKINWATETEIYDSDLDPYESGPMMAEAVRKLGFNAWICDYYDDNAQGLCLLGTNAIVSVENCIDEKNAGMVCEDIGNDTITLYHGLMAKNLEFALENGAFIPRVCSEGGPKAIWLSERQYGYQFIFAFDIPRSKVQQLTNVDYIYLNPISFNEFNCRLVRTNINCDFDGMMVHVNLLDDQLTERQFKLFMGFRNFGLEINKMFNGYPKVQDTYINPFIEKYMVLQENDGVESDEYKIGFEKGDFEPYAHVLDETNDNFQCASFKTGNAITFISFPGDERIYSTNELGMRHEIMIQRLMKNGTIGFVQTDKLTKQSEEVNKYKTGRYWVDYNTISFWSTPYERENRHYLRETVEQLQLDKETLDVDFWDTKSKINVNSPFVVPYMWFFNGTLDDMINSGAYLITKRTDGNYNVLKDDFKHVVLDRNGGISNKLLETSDVLNETPDRVYRFDTRWGDEDAIVFLYSDKDEDLLTARGLSHHQLIVKDGGNPHSDENYEDTEMRGRYWYNRNVISFWTTPPADKLEYVVYKLTKDYPDLNINTDDMLVDVWDWNSYEWMVPYRWFFNGIIDDFKNKLSSITLINAEDYTFRVQFNDGTVYYSDLEGNFQQNRLPYSAVVESRKKIIKNDEGKVVPDKCDKCGGDVVLQIHGEPVYVCKECGKYFGTMPFRRNLKENREWCETFNYTPYLKSISKFLQDNGINVKPFPHVKLHKDEQEGLYIKTGYYDPENKKVHLFINDRHPKDVLRSFTHEMIHHSQNLSGQLVGYKGETLDGDGILQKLESEAYLKGNIYFRKWTEELRPEIPTGTVKKKTKLNESIQDIYNIQEDSGDYGVSTLLNNFFQDKKKGVTKKQWRTIPAEQYKNLTEKFMTSPMMAARIPENVIYDWFENIVVPNAFSIEYITELAGHTQWFPYDEVNEEFEYWRPGMYEITDYESGYNALEAEGFYEWCSLPDGSDGWSDFGIGPIFNELANYKPGMEASDLLVLINRVLHISHCRGDLASAFIEGGSQTCSAISGIIREGYENNQNFASWFGNSKIVDLEGKPLPMYHGTNAEFTAFSKDYFTHGGTAYLGIGFNFASSDITAMGYGKNVHEVYLRAINPMTNLKKTISFKQVQSLIQTIDNKTNPDDRITTALLGDVVRVLNFSNVYKCAKIIYDYCESDGDIYTQFSVCYSGEHDELVVSAFEGLGFDSCIEYQKDTGRIAYAVVFEPNQIKSINATNFNPESDEIIDETFDIGEITNPEDVDLSSFDLNDKLNPKFWKNGRIDSRVRLALLDIADDFIDTLDVSWAEPVDIVMTGSLANYNWSQKHSDVDLHIIMNFKDVDENFDLVKDYFDSKRRLWNDEHENITIAGFQVELYVQDVHEPHASTGVYSLEKDEWLVRPNIHNFDTNYDKEAVKEKVSDYMNQIDELCDEYDESVADCDLSELHQKAVELFDKVKNERREGFNKGGGEYNVGNLIFKTLRRNGYIGKLSKIKTDTYDSLKSIYNENNENQ